MPFAFMMGACADFELHIDGEIVAATVEQVRKLFAVRRAIKGSYSESIIINSFAPVPVR